MLHTILLSYHISVSNKRYLLSRNIIQHVICKMLMKWLYIVRSTFTAIFELENIFREQFRFGISEVQKKLSDSGTVPETHNCCDRFVMRIFNVMHGVGGENYNNSSVNLVTIGPT